MAKREKKLRVVPTGQMTLQYSLPVNQARMPVRSRVATAAISTAPGWKCIILLTMRPYAL